MILKKRGVRSICMKVDKGTLDIVFTVSTRPFDEIHVRIDIVTSTIMNAAFIVDDTDLL